MSMAQAKLTPKQREMLLSFERDGEATDLCDFDSILGCRNQRKSNGGLRKARGPWREGGNPRTEC
jgi:hypothetical protein